MFSPVQITGFQAEIWVHAQLKKHGYEPEFSNWNAECCDLTVDGLPIEVKFAAKTQRLIRRKDGRKFPYPRWQWCIHPTASNHSKEWVLILIAQDSAYRRYPFILPGSLVGHRQQVQLTSHPDRYRGWMAKYLNRWDLIGYLAGKVYQDNGPLFGQVGAVYPPPTKVVNDVTL